MSTAAQQRRADRQARSAATPPARKAPLSAERITDAALELVASDGYDALTMRSVAAQLATGPASLYAHVVNKADLDELLIGRLCSRIILPTPDQATWREQIEDVCAQLRDLYLAYPGISRAALAMVVADLDVLRVNEGMLAILLGAGIPAQTAAWAIDALFLYVGAYALEISLVIGGQHRENDEGIVSRDQRAEVRSRLRALPADMFPETRRYAVELTAGTGHERFDFALGLMLDNLTSHRGGPSH